MDENDFAAFEQKIRHEHYQRKIKKLNGALTEQRREAIRALADLFEGDDAQEKIVMLSKMDREDFENMVWDMDEVIRETLDWLKALTEN